MDKPLEFHPPTVAGAGVRMATVADQLQAVKDVLDHHCNLSLLAFGGAGELGVRHYDDKCAAVSEQLGGLVAESNKLVHGLAGSAVVYVKAEDANIEAALRAFDRSPATPDTTDAPGPGALPETLAARALTTRQAATLTNRLLYSLMRREGAKITEIEQRFSELWTFGNDNGVPLFDGIPNLAFARRDASISAIEGRISSISRLSRATNAALAVGRPWSSAALIASAVWTADALVTSDEKIEVAASAWERISAAVRMVFDDEVTAIGAQLFPGWHDKASDTAQQVFAGFIAAGKALAERAERMSRALRTVVDDLNRVHTYAFYFTTAQLAMLVAYAALSYFPAARAVTEIIGQTLRVAVTVVVNVLGVLLEAAWSLVDVSV